MRGVLDVVQFNVSGSSLFVDNDLKNKDVNSGLNTEIEHNLNRGSL